MKPHCNPPLLHPPQYLPPCPPPRDQAESEGRDGTGLPGGTLGHFITESVCPEDGKRIILQTGFIAGDNSSAEPAAGRVRGPRGLRLQYCFIHSSRPDLQGWRVGDVCEEARWVQTCAGAAATCLFKKSSAQGLCERLARPSQLMTTNQQLSRRKTELCRLFGLSRATMLCTRMKKILFSFAAIVVHAILVPKSLSVKMAQASTAVRVLP